MHKYINDNLPSVFNEYFLKNSMVHERDARNKEMLRVPLYKKSLGNLFIKKAGVKIRNELNSKQNDIDVITDSGIGVFKYSLKLILIKKYVP